jgi:hypothetical protein
LPGTAAESNAGAIAEAVQKPISRYLVGALR